MNAANCASVRAISFVAIAGPISPPLPVAPWHFAQRVSNDTRPRSGACADAIVPTPTTRAIVIAAIRIVRSRMT
jgi:hypothetical protein